MFCKNCGNEIPHESSFCTNCGTKIERNIPPVTPAPTTPPPMTSSAMTPPPVAPHPVGPFPIAPSPMMPPPVPPVYSSGETKKKNKLLLSLIIAGAVLVIVVVMAVVVPAIIYFNGRANHKIDSETGDKKTEETMIKAPDNDITNNGINDTSKDSEIDNDNNLNGLGNTTDDDTEITYNLSYVYAEIPDALSLDSDTRFSYSDYYSESGVSVYVFQYLEEGAAVADFLKACDDYSILLQEMSGFTYEQEYSEQQYEETGQAANYLTRDDYGMAITVNFDESIYYAYISIFPMNADAYNDDILNDMDLPNYNYFLAGRESITFVFDEVVYMDNGMSFYIYDAIATYHEDETVTIDLTLDISSYYSDYYLDNADFLLLPLDIQGNVLSDVVPITTVTDENGYGVSMPFFLSASSYDTYTFSFPVPAETVSFLIFATNVMNEDFSHPRYIMQVGGN